MGSSHRDRLEAALQNADPIRAVGSLARVLRDEGMPQEHLYRLYSERFVITDPDHVQYDALQESLDLIAGGPWAKGGDLYPGREYEPPFSLSNGEVSAWVDGGIHLKATTSQGDPVELSADEAKVLVAALSRMIHRTS
jgi:hypothetical protein